ncbi:50S ribosomal protein L18 [Patescibacteria group bacterium]
MNRIQKKQQLRKKRQRRVRATISGTKICPRMTVYRSNKALYVQLIDDEKGITILSSSVDTRSIVSGKKLGEDIAEKATKIGIKKVVFDRSGYRYHGVIEAIANGSREGGLKF